MVNSDRKGKGGERDLAAFIRKQGFDGVRRGQQHDGLEGKDLVGLERIHIECKRVENLRLWGALHQAWSEYEVGEIPVVMHRSNRHPWIAILKLEDFLEMYRSWFVFQEYPHLKLDPKTDQYKEAWNRHLKDGQCPFDDAKLKNNHCLQCGRTYEGVE